MPIWWFNQFHLAYVVPESPFSKTAGQSKIIITPRSVEPSPALLSVVCASKRRSDETEGGKHSSRVRWKECMRRGERESKREKPAAAQLIILWRERKKERKEDEISLEWVTLSDSEREKEWERVKSLSFSFGRLIVGISTRRTISRLTLTGI